MLMAAIMSAPKSKQQLNKWSWYG